MVTTWKSHSSAAAVDASAPFAEFHTSGAPTLLNETQWMDIQAHSRNPREGGDLVFHTGSGDNQIPAFAGISTAVGICLASDSFFAGGEADEAIHRQARRLWMACFVRLAGDEQQIG